MKRILALILCVLALAVLTACGDPDKTYEKQKAAYDGIIEEYTALLTAKQNGEILTPPDTKGMDEGEAAVAEAVYAVVNACKDPENMAYAYKDMDGNGTPELLLLSSIIQMKAIFTLDGKTPMLLAYEHEGEDWYFDASGRIFFIAETISGTEEKRVDTAATHCRVDGTELVSDTEFAVTYVVKNNKRESIEYFEVVDGERQPIDKERYDALSEEFNLLFQNYGMEQKLKAPCMIFPLVELPDPRLPADFSSYDAIKTTFKEMVTYMPEARTGFTSGKFDNYFTFDSDAEFQIYNQLFGLGIRYCPDNGTFSQAFPEGGEKAYGYCEIDLNGDGKDELLLMTDDYVIFSIFTTVKGKVVPLEGYIDFAFEWGMGGMDEDGRIYSIKETTDGLGRERAVFEITSDGKLTKTLHLCEIWMSEDDGYFKFENGEKIRLTEEEYKALMEEYDKLDPVLYGSGGETVRNCTDIVFTPLFETPSIDHIPADYPWTTGYGGSQRLYLKAVEKDSTGFIWAEFNEAGEKVGVRLSDQATLTDGKYVFEENGVKGYLECGVYKIWLVVESSEDESIVPRAYLFDFYDNN